MTGWRVQVLALALLAGLLVLSAGAGSRLGARAPDGPVVPPVPSVTALRAQALGDGQAAFRARSLQLQHLGNLGGRLVPYRAMDYGRLSDWFYALDRLDPKSQVVPAAAALLYGSSPRPEHLRKVVAYLADHARRAPARAWRWQAHAVYLARYRLRDTELALHLARELAGFDAPDIPHWARQLEIFVLRDVGRVDAARALVLRLLEDGEDLPPAERRWLARYLDRELQAADEGRTRDGR